GGDHFGDGRRRAVAVVQAGVGECQSAVLPVPDLRRDPDRLSRLDLREGFVGDGHLDDRPFRRPGGLPSGAALAAGRLHQPFHHGVVLLVAGAVRLRDLTVPDGYGVILAVDLPPQAFDAGGLRRVERLAEGVADLVLGHAPGYLLKVLRREVFGGPAAAG